MRHFLFVATLLLFSVLTAYATIGPVLSETNAVNYGAGDSRDLVIYNGRGYIADGSNGIRYFSSFPSSGTGIQIPTETNGLVTRLFRKGSMLYAAEGTAGLGIYDISNGYPVLQQRYSTSGTVVGVEVQNQTVYIANHIDILVASLDANGTINSILSTLSPDGRSHKLALGGNGQFLYVAQALDGVRGFNVSDPQNVTEIFHLNDFSINSAQDVRVVDNYLIVSAWEDGLKNML